MIGQLIVEVEALGASLRRGDAVNVNDQSSKDRAIVLATRYFSEVRPRLVSVEGETGRLLQHDQLWQQLVRLAHGNNARRTHLKVVNAIRKQLSEFNISAVASPSIGISEAGARSKPSREETLLLGTLESLVPSAAASYQQGLIDLASTERFSYRGTAAEFRESLRETLDHLAPDTEVETQAWYKPEEGQKKPTMKQKAPYILRSRERNKAQRDTAEKMLGLIEELSGDVMRAVYNRASLASHVHQSRSEVQRIKRYVDTVLFDLLEIAP
jgi:hypothetical protein